MNPVIHHGDCLAVLPTLAENSIDACVTDPPYHLTSIVKRFANSPRSKNTENTENPYGRTGRGFMGKLWDGGDIAANSETWAAVYRVLKPGAHLVAFGGTRTYHRMVCAIEDAGFEIRDTIMWLYGSGFPKSHGVSKGIDRIAGAEREIVGRDPNWRKQVHTEAVYNGGQTRPENLTIPATDAAKQWQGWGTALKPACELICLARKPLSEGTVAANVLKWGTGAINVDGCRVITGDCLNGGAYSDGQKDLSDATSYATGIGLDKFNQPSGRWPANVVHDGSEEVVGRFPETTSGYSDGTKSDIQQNVFGKYGGGTFNETYGDSGTAARFFYTAKANGDERIGSKHPTVKPLDLMQYLIRLVTPHKGTVIDPFAGSGTTGEAAWREGMGAVLIEREAEYVADIRRRMELMRAGPDERSREIMKVKMKDRPVDYGPLFGGTDDWDSMWQKPFDKPELL